MARARRSNNGNGNGSGIWKTAAMILASVIITGFTAWLSFGQDTVKKDDLKDISPWTQDKAYVMGEIVSLRAALSDLNAKSDLSQRTDAELQSALAASNAKIDILLQRLSTTGP